MIVVYPDFRDRLGGGMRRINGPVRALCRRKVATAPQAIATLMKTPHIALMMMFSFHMRVLLFAGNRLNRR